jgi:hypothetical protein
MLVSVRPLQFPSLVKSRTTFSGFLSIDAFVGAVRAIGSVGATAGCGIWLIPEKSGGGSLREAIRGAGGPRRTKGTGSCLASIISGADNVVFSELILGARRLGTGDGDGTNIAALAVPATTSNDTARAIRFMTHPTGSHPENGEVRSGVAI